MVSKWNWLEHLFDPSLISREILCIFQPLWQQPEIIHKLWAEYFILRFLTQLHHTHQISSTIFCCEYFLVCSWISQTNMWNWILKTLHCTKGLLHMSIAQFSTYSILYKCLIRFEKCSTKSQVDLARAILCTQFIFDLRKIGLK